jgi:ribosomal protein S18 acetylase RimI-like enzyme
MIEPIDVTNMLEAARVLELQRVPYRIEADLIGFEIPPMRETHAELQSSGGVFHGWLEDGGLAGFVSHTLIGDTLDIHRVAVHPAFFRRGIARGLLQFVLQLEPLARRAIVQTSSLNDPGRRLYESLGFEVLDPREVAPGLSVTLFAKNLR